MKELFYNALLEGRVKRLDRVLLYTESVKMGVEYDYEEITVLYLDMSIPNQIIIKYKINTGSSEGKKFWANAAETFKDYYLFSIINDRNENNILFS